MLLLYPIFYLEDIKELNEILDEIDGFKNLILIAQKSDLGDLQKIIYAKKS